MEELPIKHHVETWMTQDMVALRDNANDYLLKALKLGYLPSKDTLEITALSGGSSVVYKVTQEGGISVIKMNPFTDRLEQEVYFLKKWKEIGVNTPDIIGFYPATPEIPTAISVMEYIDAPNLRDSMTIAQMVKLGISKESGRILAMMHGVKGKGFGEPLVAGSNLVEGKEKTLSEEIKNFLFDPGLPWLIDQGIVDRGVEKDAQLALEILEEDIARGTRPSLTHNDFRPVNILATSPLTVFDPIPRITHPLLCLAFVLVKSEVEGDGDLTESEDILKGYKEVNLINEKSLTAAKVIKSLTIIHTWARKSKNVKVLKALKVLKKSTDYLKER